MLLSRELLHIHENPPVIRATIIVVMVARITITMVRMRIVICIEKVRLRTGCHGCGSRFTILSLACASASAT